MPDVDTFVLTVQFRSGAVRTFRGPDARSVFEPADELTKELRERNPGEYPVLWQLTHPGLWDGGWGDA